MPIVGLTDKIAPQLPVIGKLRKGGERGPRRPGADLTYFRFTSDRPEVVAAFRERIGSKPQILRVYLPYADLESNFSTWKEEWVAGGLVHRCDGKNMVLWRTADGQYAEAPLGQGPQCPGGCSPVGRLSLVIPELWQTGYVGLVTLETHSINDILLISRSLQAVLDARAGNPLGLRGIVFTLRRQPRMISTPSGNGQRVRREKWLVCIEPDPQWVQLQIEAARAAAYAIDAGPVEPAAIPAPMPGTYADADDEEVEIAEIEEPEEPVEAPTEQAQQNGRSLRPADPETVREWMQAKAMRGSYAKAAAGLRGAANGALENLFPNASQDSKILMRRQLIEFFFGRSSSKDLADGECRALLAWAQDRIEENGLTTYFPNEYAIKEAQTIIEYIGREHGQQQLL